MTRTAWLGSLVLLVACSGSTSDPSPGSDGTIVQGAACSETAGATWTLEKSRFAFGSTPTEQGPGRWVGPEGVVATFGGRTMGSLNSGASASGRPDFVADTEALKQHVRSYLLGFGIQECQIGEVQVLGSGGGGGPVGGPSTTVAGHRTIALTRVVAGLPVVDSSASAQINDQDQSTQETLAWPALDPQLLADAKAFRDQLADPAALEAYRATLPSNLQLAPTGQVGIHHPPVIGDKPLKFYVSYDTMAGRSPVSFDRTGKLIVPSWE